MQKAFCAVVTACLLTACGGGGGGGSDGGGGGGDGGNPTTGISGYSAEISDLFTEALYTNQAATAALTARSTALTGALSHGLGLTGYTINCAGGGNVGVTLSVDNNSDGVFNTTGGTDYIWYTFNSCAVEAAGTVLQAPAAGGGQGGDPTGITSADAVKVDLQEVTTNAVPNSYLSTHLQYIHQVDANTWEYQDAASGQWQENNPYVTVKVRKADGTTQKTVGMPNFYQKRVSGGASGPVFTWTVKANPTTLYSDVFPYNLGTEPLVFTTPTPVTVQYASGHYTLVAGTLRMTTGTLKVTATPAADPAYVPVTAYNGGTLLGQEDVAQSVFGAQLH